MHNISAWYNNKFEKNDGDVFELFEKFYTTMNLSPIMFWLDEQFKTKVVKDNNRSTVLRLEGNKFFAKNNMRESLAYYTRSVCSATPYSTEYGLALGNRSAVSFRLNRYRECLKDIESCLKTKFPMNVKPRVLIRKAECCLQLGDCTGLQNSLHEISIVLKNGNIRCEDKLLSKLSILKRSSIKHHNLSLDAKDAYELPSVESGENESFTFASSKIKMSYTKPKGRHVVASTNINRGDILFVEKAFIFAPVFSENKELNLNKCNHCLKEVITSIPCKKCVRCLYCDKDCRKESWEECHKWECEGMQANIWYELGIVYPAFRAMLKGISREHPIIDGPYEKDLKKFGDKDNNYPYFSRLISNIDKIQNVTPFIVMAATVVMYLFRYPDFYSCLTGLPWGMNTGCRPPTSKLGGLLVLHALHLISNSSTVEHWTRVDDPQPHSDAFQLTPVACAIYPAVSIMNHSCRPNTAIYFVRDTIVVSALEDIAENEEIYNCYGIHYTEMPREKRQRECMERYHFECTCVICSDPTKEVANGGSFCPADIIFPQEYLDGNDVEKMSERIHMWLKQQKAKVGANSRIIGLIVLEIVVALQKLDLKSCTNVTSYKQLVEHMMKEAKCILNLHYPRDITEELMGKVQQPQSGD